MTNNGRYPDYPLFKGLQRPLELMGNEFEKGRLISRSRCHTDWPLIRYTDVLLQYAEALAQTCLLYTSTQSDAYSRSVISCISHLIKRFENLAAFFLRNTRTVVTYTQGCLLYTSRCV